MKLLQRKPGAFLHIAFVVIISFSFVNRGYAHAQESDGALKGVHQAAKLQKMTNNKDWFYTGMEMSFITLNVVDLALTHYSLKNGAREANPIARLYIDNVPLSIVVKGGVTVGVIYFLRRLKQERKTHAYVSLAVLNVVYGFVVNNNIGIAFEISK